MVLRLPFQPKTRPLRVEVEGVLASRRTRYEYQLLDASNNIIGPLDGVRAGGTLKFNASASVKGTGSIPVADLGHDIDWLNVRIKIIAHISDDARPEYSVPLGVFIPAAPVEQWKDGRRSWEIELADLTSILDQDIITGPNNTPQTYSLAAGSCVLCTSESIIVDAGEQPFPKHHPGFPGDTHIARDMTWDIDATRLRVINDLLDAGNFLSLWADGNGDYRVSRAIPPHQRPVLYEMWGPLQSGPRAMFRPEWQHDRDIYSIPNRLLAVEEGDGDDEGQAAIAVNMDPSSPFSYPSRDGRWITEIIEGQSVTAADGALQEWTERRLAQMSEVSSAISVEHLFLPDLMPNDVIRFSAGDLENILTRVQSTEITLDPGSLVKTELRQVVDTEAAS